MYANFNHHTRFLFKSQTSPALLFSITSTLAYYHAENLFYSDKVTGEFVCGAILLIYACLLARRSLPCTSPHQNPSQEINHNWARSLIMPVFMVSMAMFFLVNASPTIATLLGLWISPCALVFLKMPPTTLRHKIRRVAIKIKV